MHEHFARGCRIGAMAKREEPVELSYPDTPSAGDVLATVSGEPHAVARCRWCGGFFRRVFGFQWVCESVACCEKQIAQAMLKANQTVFPSPFLYLPLPLQVDIETIPTRRLLIHGPAGISKSFGARWSLYKRCRKIPGYSALLLRCTYDQLEKNHLKFMHREATLLGDATYERGAVKRMVIPNADGESEVRFGYLDDAADIEQHVGPEYDEVLIDEASKMIPKGIREVTSRDRGSATSRVWRAANGDVRGRSRLFTNPGGRASLFLRDFFIDKNPDPVEFPKYNPEYYGDVTGDIRDNPYLDADFEQASLGGLDRVRNQQLAKGDWSAVEGQFFDFDIAIHVREMEAQ